DQPGVAARIAAKQVGVVLSPDHASPRNVVAAIKQVLGDATVRDNVQSMQEAIRSIDGLSIAAGILESTFALEERQLSPVSRLGDNQGSAASGQRGLIPHRQEHQCVERTTPSSASTPMRDVSARPSKVAIVTGASRGIGLEAVKRLAANGYRVV